MRNCYKEFPKSVTEIDGRPGLIFPKTGKSENPKTMQHMAWDHSPRTVSRFRTPTSLWNDICCKEPQHIDRQNILGKELEIKYQNPLPQNCHLHSISFLKREKKHGIKWKKTIVIFKETGTKKITMHTWQKFYQSLGPITS